MEMRKDNAGLYFDFIEFFVSSVVGKIHYKYHKCDKLLSQFTSVSDEALAILIFENNINTWKDMADKNITKNSTVIRKYTNGGSSQGEVASSRKYQGWSSCGLKRFNELFDYVKADCASSHAKQFELSFQEFCVNGGVSGKSKKLSKPLHEAIKIRHELWLEPDVMLQTHNQVISPNEMQPNKNVIEDSPQVLSHDNMQANEIVIEESPNTTLRQTNAKESDDEDPYGNRNNQSVFSTNEEV